MTFAALTRTRPAGFPFRIDRVWLVIAAVFSALAIYDTAFAAQTAGFTLSSLFQVAPYLAASIGIAAYAKASGADALIARAFQGRIALMVVFAALMGGLSPFCSCGVIPLIAALLAMGVPLAAVMAFWLASPIMDPSMFILTTGVLGLPFAIAKTLAAIGVGMFGGYTVMLLQGRGIFLQPLRPGVGNGGCGAGTVRDSKAIVWRFWQEPGRRHAFAKDALKNTLFLGKWLTLAFVLESLMIAWVPAEMVVGLVGGSGWLPVIIATFAGVPAYLNGYAALPLVGGLIDQGMAPGAAMAFLVGGGVTSIPAAIAVFALARLPVFLTYVGVAMAGSMIAGLLYGLVA